MDTSHLMFRRIFYLRLYAVNEVQSRRYLDPALLFVHSFCYQKKRGECGQQVIDLPELSCRPTELPRFCWKCTAFQATLSVPADKCLAIYISILTKTVLEQSRAFMKVREVWSTSGSLHASACNCSNQRRLFELASFSSRFLRWERPWTGGIVTVSHATSRTCWRCEAASGTRHRH